MTTLANLLRLKLFTDHSSFMFSSWSLL